VSGPPPEAGADPAPPRGTTTLAQVCADLGPELVEVSLAPRGVDVELADVTLHDALDLPEPPQLAGHLVLVVGIAPADPGVPRLLRIAAGSGAVALACRGAGGWPEELLRLGDTLGLALLTIAPGVTWAEVYDLIRASVASDRGQDPGGIGRPALGDLFALADATAALAGGPVTIEDVHSRVLAFSGGQAIDQGRMATILDRRVPEHWMRMLRSHGILERLLVSAEVLHVDLPDMQPRRAIAIRSGGGFLGSIWLAAGETVTAGADEALRRAAGVAAVHMLRRRTTEDLGRRVRTQALTTLLRGEGPSAVALRQLGLPAEGGLVVLAIAPRPGASAWPAATGERLVDLVTLHLNAYRRPAVATLFDGRVYVLAVSRGAGDRDAIRQLTADAIARAQDALGVELRAGIGQHVPEPAPERIARARRSAERCLELGPPASLVVAFEEIQGRMLLEDVEAFVAGRGDAPSPQLEALLEHDRRHGTELVATLRGFLDALGSAPRAAERLHVHANTMRYRLRRIAELTGLDLADGDGRLALELELRGLRPRAPRSG
jgi:hypothetical protein